MKGNESMNKYYENNGMTKKQLLVIGLTFLLEKNVEWKRETDRLEDLMHYIELEDAVNELIQELKETGNFKEVE